jgi:hypothetical protein
MEDFERARLWTESLARQAEPDASADVRENLRSAFMNFRLRAAALANEIARDLPDYTVHDIKHLDALWHLADLIGGKRTHLTPLESFVLGGAFLVHDLGMGLAAYPDGISSLRSSPTWDDAMARELRHQLGRAPTTAELRSPNASVEKVALGNVLRSLHAEHAERLALVSWTDPDSKEQHHLIEDSFLRQHFGKLIGSIAHSHWWPARNLPVGFRSVVGPPAGYHRDWIIDPVKLACLLRVADAAHLDGTRAPMWLKTIRKPQESSRKHWVFQEKLHQPIREDDRLLFTSTPFGINDAEAWWMCFDALQLLDQELADVDSILSDSHRKQLAIRGVKGAGQADRLCRWVETDGWLPVDTRIRVNDVAGLAKELGGEQLYGKNRLVPLRELIQNASDAIRARSFLQSLSPERGEVTVRTGTDLHGHYIEVVDNGVGMSQSVLTGYLLDFGRSFWSGSHVSDELPGLLASGFEPTGKYGIGFFSVFMWSKHVRVTSRRYDEAQSDTHVLEFTAGLDSRPLLRRAATAECLHDGGTVVRVWLERDAEEPGGVLDFESERWISRAGLADACLWLCPALDTNLSVERQKEPPVRLIRASDWKTISNEDLIRRMNSADLEDPDEDEVDDDDEDRDEVSMTKLSADIVSMLRPLHDSNGNLVGRMALIPSTWYINWYELGAVTVGGFRGAELGGAAGILLGHSTRASRDSAIPEVPITELQRWAREQEDLVVANTKDAGILIECAGTVRACGFTPKVLPIAQDRGGPKTAEQIRSWASARDVITLISHDSLFSLGRKLGAIELAENVLCVQNGYRAIVMGSSKGTRQRWPNNLDFYKLTLEGAVADVIAQAWAVPPERVTDELGRRGRVVIVGTAGGKSIRTRATVLTRNTLTPTGG